MRNCWLVLTCILGISFLFPFILNIDIDIDIDIDIFWTIHPKKNKIQKSHDEAIEGKILLLQIPSVVLMHH
jgi:hypothetical protein